MKSMKNIKRPQYAVSMGKGLFKGYDDDEFATVWFCTWCNKKVKSNGQPPSGDDCNASPYGWHFWKQAK